MLFTVNIKLLMQFNVGLFGNKMAGNNLSALINAYWFQS